MNADGNLDVLVANRRSNSFSVLHGAGDGTFPSESELPTGAGPSASAVADFDGDGQPDVVITNELASTISLYQNDGSGIFSIGPRFLVGARPVSVVVGDFTGDGHPDIATSNAFGYTVTILDGIGNGDFTYHGDFAVGDQPISIGAGDLNGDGRLDLLVANSLSSSVSVMLNTGGLPAVGVEPPSGLPALFNVRPARPNPAHGPCEVRFTLPSARPVRVDVFDVAGRLVRALQPEAQLPTGAHTAIWDGRDDAGTLVRDGVYIFQVRAGADVTSRKVIRLR